MVVYQGYKSLERIVDDKKETKAQLKPMFGSLGSDGPKVDGKHFVQLLLAERTTWLFRREGLMQNSRGIIELMSVVCEEKIAQGDK